MNQQRAALAVVALAALAPREALATGFEFPSNGVESFSRGSAWLARATDPMAAYHNPAALARNGSGVSLSSNLIWQKACFSRRYGGSDPVANGVTAGASDQLYYQTCNDGKLFPNPQLALQYRVSDKLGVGMALMGPSAYGKTTFPLFASNTSLGRSNYGQPVQGPSSTRYIVSDLDNILVWPQISAGYEVAKNIRVGASFIWGFALIGFSNVSMGFNASQGLDGQKRLNETSDQDVLAKLTARDWFIPGFVLSSLATVVDNESTGVDVAAWFHWSDSIKAKGQAELSAFLYTKDLQQEPSPVVKKTGETQVSLDVPQPWQARAGARFYKKRPGAARTRALDPLRDEVFDIEIDVEYTRDSAFQNLGVTFNKPDVVLTLGDPGAPINITIPPDASIPHRWKDAFGVRVGGDFAVIPSKLALRGGAWFQSANVDAADMHLDFIGAQRIGLTGGATLRLGPVDLQAGYGHIFFKTLDNGGNGALRAITGSATTQNGTPPNRSDYAVNGGSLKAKADIVSLGVVYRWE